MTTEEALATIKGKDETWLQVFSRVNSTRGIDTKTLMYVIISILEELDARKDKSNTSGEIE